MLIHGTLSDYNPGDAQQVFVLLDKTTGRISVAHNTMYLAFTSKKRLELQESKDGDATLVLQVDLTRARNLFSFCSHREGVEAKPLKNAQSFSAVLDRATFSPLCLVWPILFSIACGFRSVKGDTFSGGSAAAVTPAVLAVDSIASLSDSVVTVVDEYVGMPKDGSWARLPMHAATPLFGGTIFEAISEYLQIPATTVQDVLAATATVATNTALAAFSGGAEAVNIVVPPLGILEYRLNVLMKPTIVVNLDLSYEVPFGANSALRDGVWSFKSLFKKFKKLSKKRQNRVRYLFDTDESE